MKFIGIIPARYASTRFPGKPLAVLGGKPVVQRVYEQVASVLGEAYVATDDERIFQTVERFGGRAVMTRADHKSGTDRIEEAAQLLHTDADVIINVQGDEPFIQKSQLETVKALFDDPQVQIGTLGKPFETMEQVENPNSPKIVTDVNGYALYFSRSVIPYIRDTSHLSPLTSHLSPLTSQAHRPLCLSPRGAVADNEAAPEPIRISREFGAVAMVAKRLPHQGGPDQC